MPIRHKNLKEIQIYKNTPVPIPSEKTRSSVFTSHPEIHSAVLAYLKKIGMSFSDWVLEQEKDFLREIASDNSQISRYIRERKTP